jgi:hypothetical protein
MANALVNALSNTRKILTQKNVSLLDVVRAIQVDANTEAPAPAKVTLPTLPKLSTDERTQLLALVDAIDTMRLPVTRRKLTAPERARVLEATEQFKGAEKVVKSVVEALKTSFFNHLDVLAEESGEAVPGVTPRDKNGFYLLTNTEAGIVQGEPKKLTREFSNGSVAVTLDGLDGLVATGKISATERKKMTKTVEVVDEDAVIQFMADHPDRIPSIVPAIKQKSASSVSFQVRSNR